MGPQRLKWWRTVICINDETTKFVTARGGEKRLFERGGEYSHHITRLGETWHEYVDVPPGCGIVPASSGAALNPDPWVIS